MLNLRCLIHLHLYFDGGVGGKKLRCRENIADNLIKILPTFGVLGLHVRRTTDSVEWVLTSDPSHSYTV